MENLAANNYDEKLNLLLQYYTPTDDGRLYNKRRKNYKVPQMSWDGYAEHELTINGKRYWSRAHKLVAYYFIPNPERLPVTNHLDGDKLNNAVGNLEWTTVSGNTKHSYEMGLQVGKSGNTVFTDDEVRFIRQSRKAGKLRDEILQHHFSHVKRDTFFNVWYKQTYKEISE